MSNNSNPTTLFVADTHFHLRPEAAEQKRLQRFLAFLEMAQKADHLVLLGDIFDFWFDYPHFRLRGYEELLTALDAVRKAGVRLHFVGGNHDIWAVDYLVERYAIAGAGEPIDLKLGERQVRLIHGDGLLTKDWLYSTFRWVVRRRAGIWLAKSLHPELLFGLASWLSGASRNVTRELAEVIVTKAETWLASQKNPPWDLVVIGHVHHPFMLEHQGRTMAVLGGWLGREGYAILQNGHFQLRDFATDPPPDFTIQNPA